MKKDHFSIRDVRDRNAMERTSGTPNPPRLETIDEARERLWESYLSAPPYRRLQALDEFKRCERIRIQRFAD